MEATQRPFADVPPAVLAYGDAHPGHVIVLGRTAAHVLVSDECLARAVLGVAPKAVRRRYRRGRLPAALRPGLVRRRMFVWRDLQEHFTETEEWPA